MWLGDYHSSVVLNYPYKGGKNQHHRRRAGSKLPHPVTLFPPVEGIVGAADQGSQNAQAFRAEQPAAPGF